MERTAIRSLFITVIPLLAASVPLTAADVSPPFVAAFERFGRPKELDTETAGRLLLSELSCTACHSSTDPQLLPKRGPRLDDVGSRLQHDWLRRFLISPSELKPGTTMPEMLDSLSDENRTSTVDALVAYLQSLTQPFPEIKGTGARPVPHEFWKHGDPQQGLRLYHQIGCVACHAVDDTWETVSAKPSPLDEILQQLDPEELKEAGLLSAARRVESVPLGNPAEKYTHQSLTHFLLDPHRVRPGGRMPNFQLGVVEAADIAAWLLQTQPIDSVQASAANKSDPALIDRGRTLFTDLGCAACHDIEDIKPQSAARPLIDLDEEGDKSCLSQAAPGQPHFELDPEQRAVVQAALASLGDQSDQQADADFTMLQMNCLSCHERNQLGGVGRYRKPYFETRGHVDIGDEGRLPPPLTGVGRKLKQGWLSKVLQGKGSVRAHMHIRMPVFSSSVVKSMPALLANADADNPKSEAETFGSLADLNEPGRQLLNTGCVQCHPLRGEAVPGVVGIDLEGVASRVHPAWFHEFLLDPGALKPHTRMPSFFPGGKSQNQNILGGNTDRQIAAMWTYLKGVRTGRLPDKIEQSRSQSYELKPTERPILLRTFMEQAGTHAIAVGFPDQVHFAFDAEQIRPALAWRGGFLDAQGTWFVRFAPPAKPLGNNVIGLPAGFPFALLQDPKTPWPESSSNAAEGSSLSSRFLGYRLDTDNVPTFLYRLSSIDIEDRLVPGEEHQLIRQITFKQSDEEAPRGRLWFRAHVGKQLELTDGTSCQDSSGLRVSMNNNADAVLRQQGTEMEWLIPVTLQSTHQMEVQYRW